MASIETGGDRPWLAVGREVTELLERIDPRHFADLTAFCGDDGARWFFSGQGRSGLVAEMAAMRFMHLGRTAHVVGEATAPSIRAGDRMITLSGSGETPTSVHVTRIARAEGARTALLTSRPDSTLATLTDPVLEVPATASAQFGGSLFEQSCLLLLDAVAAVLATRTPDAHELMMQRHTNLQ